MLPILLQCGEEHCLYIVVWVRVKYYCNSYCILVSCRLEREQEINAAGGAANSLILKNPVTHRQSSLLLWHGHFDWQVYQLCFQEWFENSSLTCRMPWRKASQDCLRKDLLHSMILNFTLKQHLLRKINTRTRDGEPGFDCFIWQPHLAFTSPFIAGKHSLICTTTLSHGLF